MHENNIPFFVICNILCDPFDFDHIGVDDVVIVKPTKLDMEVVLFPVHFNADIVCCFIVKVAMI
jgi:hypothetical protein